jgi:signal transduction histidine kinase
VVSIKDGKITTFTTSNGLTSNRVNSLFEDRDGSIWIGAGDDLLIYKDGLFKQVNIAQFASGVRVRAMAQTSDGSIWIGTLLGLLRIRGSDIRIYTQRDGLSDHRIFTLYVDKDGTLWIGTAGGGLNRFKHGTFLYYKHSYGFPTDSITSIIEDDQESIWIGSNQGIFRVSKHLFDDFDQKRIEHITSFSYDSSDGIRNGECNNVQYGSWKDRDGNVWFATIDGIVVAAPSKIQLNTIPPLVYIEEVLADRLPIDLERNNRLSPSIRDIEIRYAGLSFVATEKVKFKYLLEGFDKEWIDAGNRRFAHYTNLPPGHYTFKVIASNNDGIWNQKGDTFAFYIRPHIYQTWWFIALCALILMLIVWQVHSWSVRQMKRRMTLIMDERTRLARELHDTLEQSLAMASMHLESGTAMLDGISERAMHHLELARTLVSHTVSEAKRAVWDLRSENLENADLMTAFSKIAHQLNIDNLISVEVKVSGKSRPIPSNIEHTLFRIGQEAITNAVKHARASRIEVEIEFNPGSIILSVRDNGAGFDPLSVPSISKGHFGIAGMRERAEGIGGTFSIKSDAKDGSEISVEVKT